MENITILDYIKYISLRPNMYLRENSYKELINHLSYFISFKKMFNLMLQDDVVFINKFPEWICQKYGFSVDNKNNWDLFLENNNPEPMDIFLKEVELFRNAHTSV